MDGKIIVVQMVDKLAWCAMFLKVGHFFKSDQNYEIFDTVMFHFKPNNDVKIIYHLRG